MDVGYFLILDRMHVLAHDQAQELNLLQDLSVYWRGKILAARRRYNTKEIQK